MSNRVVEFCAVCTKRFLFLDSFTITTGICLSCHKKYGGTSQNPDWVLVQASLQNILSEFKDENAMNDWGINHNSICNMLTSFIAINQTGKNAMLAAVALGYLGFDKLSNALLKRLDTKIIKIYSDVHQGVMAVSTPFSYKWNSITNTNKWVYHGDGSLSKKGGNFRKPFVDSEGKLHGNVRVLPSKEEILLKNSLYEVFGKNIILEFVEDGLTMIAPLHIGIASSNSE